MESGEIMYGGRHRPANPMIARIRAVLNPSFRAHFQITWASIAASTSWTQAHLYFRPPERECFRLEPGPTPDMQNPLETTVELRWETYLREDVQETSDLSFTTLLWAGAWQEGSSFRVDSRKLDTRQKQRAYHQDSLVPSVRHQRSRRQWPSIRPPQ